MDVNLPQLLNHKYLEWQYKQGSKKTIEEFADTFGVSKALMSLWMNGKRSPGPEHKKAIIARYGIEALEAFGEDPDLYAITELWELLPPDVKQTLREQAEQATNNKKPAFYGGFFLKAPWRGLVTTS